MSKNEEKRKAGDFEIIHALHIGDKKIVLGENPAGASDERYMCAFCEENALAVRENVMRTHHATVTIFRYQLTVTPFLASLSEKGGVFVPKKLPQHRPKPPPKHTRFISPEERTWLDRINSQLAYDEYMQAKREFWLAERPRKKKPDS